MKRCVVFFGYIACFVLLPLQIVTALTYIVGRQFFDIPATPLQELEWHLFTACVFFTIGFAYLQDRHVRIDIVRERLGARTRAWIELIGFVIAVLPFCALFIWQGSVETWASFVAGERSRAALGLEYRWVIRATVPLGALLLLIAGILVFQRNVKLLRGRI